MHNTGVTNTRVFAVAVTTTQSQPMYFPAVGASQGTDRRGTRNYGGVIYAYSATNVQLWVPAVSVTAMTRALGKSINIGDGWGNGTTVVYQIAAVRVFFFDDR